MSHQAKPRSFPFRSDERLTATVRPPHEQGYAFLILLMTLTILLISLTVALPNVYTEAQREREEELIFRGNQYARAILLYHNQFNRYPVSVDDLIKRTNGFRFLARAYRDPMTRDGQWRFVHVNAAGAVLDSKTLSLQQPKPGQGQPGTQGTQTGQGQSTTGSPSAFGGPSGSSTSSSFVSSPTMSMSPTSPTSTSSTGIKMPELPPAAPNGEIKGLFIVGVASRSTKRSFRVWNNHDRYDEWEFIGLPQQATGGTVAPQAAGQPGTAQQSPTGPSPMSPASPTSNPNPM